MSDYSNVKLIDQIRHDALMLLKSRNNTISYGEAFELAKTNLIGRQKVTDVVIGPFSLEINLGNKNTLTGVSEEVLEDNIDNFYVREAKKVLKNKINIANFDDAQLKALLVADSMGVDITKFASEEFSAEQINFFAVLLSSGEQIDEYLNNPGFDPNIEFTKLATKA